MLGISVKNQQNVKEPWRQNLVRENCPKTFLKSVSTGCLVSLT